MTRTLKYLIIFLALVMLFGITKTFLASGLLTL